MVMRTRTPISRIVGCPSGKTTYLVKRTAELTADEFMRHYGTSRIRVYECPEDDGGPPHWHLSTARELE